MKKIIGFIVGTGILVAIGVWFIQKNPEFFQRVVDWAFSQMGIN